MAHACLVFFLKIFFRIINARNHWSFLRIRVFEYSAHPYILILPVPAIGERYRDASVIQCSIFVHIAGSRWISICYNTSDAPENDNLDRFLDEKCLKIWKKSVFSQNFQEFPGEFGKDQIPRNSREFPNSRWPSYRGILETAVFLASFGSPKLRT